MFAVFSNVSQANIPALSVNGNNLVHSPAKKFIGLLEDNKLNFVPYIRDICIKVSRGIGVCKNLTMMMPFDVRRNFFLLSSIKL